MKHLKKLATTLAFSSLLVGHLALAKEYKGIDMPDGVVLHDTMLFLNGIGVRIVNKYFVNWDVYVAGLYVRDQTDSASKILESDGPKCISFGMLKHVSAADLVKAFEEGLVKNGSSAAKYPAEMALVKETLVDVKPQDRMTFAFIGETMEITVPGKDAVTVASAGGFAKDVLKIWLGEPLNPELKKGLLGLYD